MSKEKPSDLLTLDEAAAQLNRERRTVLGYATSGLLPRVEIEGGKVRFRRGDIDALPAKLTRRGRPSKYD